MIQFREKEIYMNDEWQIEREDTLMIYSFKLLFLYYF